MPAVRSAVNRRHCKPHQSDIHEGVLRRAVLAADRRAGSTSAAFAEHDAHEIGGIFLGGLVHDAAAMRFDGARADAELSTGLLVGSALRDPSQDLALARGEPLVAGIVASYKSAVGSEILPRAQRVMHAHHHGGGLERLLDEIERA